MPTPRFRLYIATLIAIHTALVVGCIYRNSFTATEPGLLASGLLDWRVGNFDHYRVNPPLVRMWSTISLVNVPVDLVDAKTTDRRDRPEWPAARSMFQSGGPRTLAWLRQARLFCLPFAMTGMFVVVCWTRELWGDHAAVGSAILWCFHPSLIGYGGLISGDAQAASMGVLTFWLFRHWLRQPRVGISFWLGTAMGACVLTKFSWLTIFLLMPLLWSIVRLLEWRLDTGGDETRRTSARLNRVGCCRQVALGTFSVIVALVVINGCYEFRGSCKSLGSYQFISRALAGSENWTENDFTGNRFACTRIGLLPVPFPEPFVLGLDLQKWDFDRERWSYFHGEWRCEGWWHYYLIGWIFKTPLGLLGLWLLAAVLRLRQWRTREQLTDEIILIGVPAAFFILASAETGLNRHLRYVLPAIAMLIIWTSRVFVVFSPEPNSDEVSNCHKKRQRLRLIVSACTVAFIASSLCSYPRSLSYFNLLAGGPRGSHAWFNASNIDWGQDLLEVKWWQERNPHKHPLFIEHHYTLVPPASLGIQYEEPPAELSESGFRQSDRLSALKPGWYIIDREALIEREKRFQYFNGIPPLEILGDNYYVYFLSQAKCDMLIDTYGIEDDSTTTKEPRGIKIE